MTTSLMGTTVRLATEADLDAIQSIEDDCFPFSDEQSESAAAGEFEEGLDNDGLMVADMDGVGVIGYVQFGPTGPESYFLFGCAVLPDYRRRGVARTLVAAAIGAIKDRSRGAPEIAATTAPANAAMVRALTGLSFEATTYVQEYFGPGKSRLYFIYIPNNGYTQVTERLLLPAGSVAALSELLDGNRRIIRAIRLPHGWHYEVATRVELDSASRLTNEVAVSSAFAGSLLAAFAFLFGFALTVPAIPSDLVGATGACLLISLFSLVAYTNASGELARLESGSLGQFMHIGNVWSEFGGVYALLSLTPTLVVAATDGAPGAIAISIVASLLNFAYHRSPVNIVRRYTRARAFWKLVEWCFLLLPVAAVGIYFLTDATWIWTLVLTVVTTAALFAGLRANAETP